MKKFIKYKYRRSPMTHQHKEMLNSADAEYWALLWDMGVGKTKFMFDKAQYLFLKNEIKGLLIIAPNGVHVDHIEKEVSLDVGIPNNSAYYRSTLRKAEQKKIDKLALECNNKLKILSLNTDSIRTPKGYKLIKTFLEVYPSLMVIDESSDFANDTARTKKLLELGKLAKYRMIMDGTPVNQGPLDLYYPCEFLKPGLLSFPTYTSYRARYAILGNTNILKDLDKLLCVTRSEGQRRMGERYDEFKLPKEKQELLKEERFLAKTIYNMHISNVEFDRERVLQELPKRLHHLSGYIVNVLKRTPLFVFGYKNLEELNKKIKPFSSRVLLEDCVDLPGLTEKTITYDLNSETRRIYNSLRDDFLVEITENKDIISIRHAISKYVKLQQMIGGFYKSDDDPHTYKTIPGDNQKLQLLLSTIKRINQKYKIIIFARFVEEIKLIYKTLIKEYGKESTVTYYGGNTNDEKQKAKQQLKENLNCRFFVVNPTSGSLGLNLISANYTMWFSRTFSLRKNLQGIKRTYRKGQTRHCHSINLVAKGTIDPYILNAIQKKQSVADYITGDVGRMLK
jgi:SNF2 family DNA or RNA helicase